VIFAGTTRIIRVSEKDETRARELIKRISDKEYSYTDATSFAIMERLHIRDVFTLDKHFGQYGLHLFS
jgi:predicted nucleic acid-binding protein